MSRTVISTLEGSARDIEVVERKGLGHPDTICDALAETFSRNLCRLYLERFGEVLHHNVDKALLCGGTAAPAYGGGEVLSPMAIILAGRVTGSVGGKNLPIEEIAIEGSRGWLRHNLRSLDADRHVAVSSRVAAGSADLQALFARNRNTPPLANDTSIGVGYAPLSPLEQLVLKIEKVINGGNRSMHRAWGEDVKVMGVRRGQSVDLTVACAMVGRHVANRDAYVNEKDLLRKLVSNLAQEQGFGPCQISVNAGDDISSDQVFLTVTGTSAESGDDGEVGRGNRANGLITPCRPMSLEAVAGKNPRSHVGKIYNVAARELSERLVSALPGVLAAQCLLVSRIGSPITEPALVQVQIVTADGLPVEDFVSDIESSVAAYLPQIPNLIDAFIAGEVSVF